ncbi:MAG TPA: aminotransferase class V-fold PLP-dependent enzyme [Candidatus Eisenbacteria bacterium]|nr:aminotransferase class V-fold PLP-dependent enzyme [Candidatus Eisenbacteria bacterium]
MSSPVAAADPLLVWRAEFPALEHTLHFASHTLGAMPRGVDEALARYTRTWRTRGIRAWEEEWFALPTEVGNVLARVLNAAPGSVTMTENVTTAQALALSALDFTPSRPGVVCTEEDFPSVLYLYEGLERRGASLLRVPARGAHDVDVERIVRAIDERTAVVAMSHVLFRSASVLDLAPVVARAHAVGARVMVDAYQSVGTVPLDVAALGVDFVTGGSVKWLCGGPGAGWLYVSPAIAPELEPAITGWFAHENPFAFDIGPTRRDRGARRFYTGTPNIPGFTAARPGYEIVAAIGTAAIRAKSLRQTGRMIALADEYGIAVVSPRESARRGGTVCLDVPNAERVCAALLAEDVLLDFRPGVGLRLAPHFYTRDDEVEGVMARVRDHARRLA